MVVPQPGRIRNEDKHQAPSSTHPCPLSLQDAGAFPFPDLIVNIHQDAGALPGCTAQGEGRLSGVQRWPHHPRAVQAPPPSASPLPPLLVATPFLTNLPV